MKFELIKSRCVVLPHDDVDTDQIIPARFLSGVDRTGLGENLFFALRQQPDCRLNAPELRAAEILIAGRNFGCGSSREHAVWALTEWGFRVVIAPSFGDIFRANALKNGLLIVELSELAVASIRDSLSDRFEDVSVDLKSCRVTTSIGGQHEFQVDSFARKCLLEGISELDYLLAQIPKVEAFERARR